MTSYAGTSTAQATQPISSPTTLVPAEIRMPRWLVLVRKFTPATTTVPSSTATSMIGRIVPAPWKSAE